MLGHRETFAKNGNYYCYAIVKLLHRAETINVRSERKFCIEGKLLMLCHRETFVYSANYKC